MADFRNLGFEDPGLAVGDADGWVYSFLAQAEYIAPILPQDVRPAEDFERDWGIDAYLDAFGAADLTRATYGSGPEQQEDFESEWLGNEGFKFEIFSSEVAAYSTTSDAFEAFEREWLGNDAFIFVLADGPTSVAIYNSTTNAFEAFEREWFGNQDNLMVFAPGDLTAASYYTGGEGVSARDVEDFETVHAPQQVIPEPTIFNAFGATAHGLLDGYRVTFFAGPNGQIPAGLFENFAYFVIYITADIFQVAQSSGGGEVDFTSTGYGDVFVQRSLRVCWVEVLA